MAPPFGSITVWSPMPFASIAGRIESTAASITDGRWTR